MLWSRSRPEPDFLAGAGAGEKAPALPLRLHKVATIFVKFSHILTIYTQIERKNRYTLKKTKLLTLVFKTALFT